jgi:hypothetical protein
MKQNLTKEMIQESSFYKTRPKVIRKLMDELPSTHEYMIIDTGHVCTIHSYNENGTVSVMRPIEDGDLIKGIPEKTEWIKVFGLEPADLKLIEDKPIEVESDDLRDSETHQIKMQRSLSSDDEERMLLYTKDRKFEYEGSLTDAARKFMKHDVKVYAEAEIIPNGDGTFRFSLVHLIKDQSW